MMNRFTLKFSNTSIESEYSKLKYKPFMESIAVTFFFLALFGISWMIPAITHNNLPGIFATIGMIVAVVITALLRERLKKYRKLIVFLIIVTFYYVRTERLPDTTSRSEEIIFMRGYMISSIQISLMSQFPKLCHKIVGIAAAFGLRTLMMGITGKAIFQPDIFVRFVCIDLFVAYLFYTNEKSERKLFLDSWEYREKFKKFKELVENYLPQSIVIFQAQTNKCLFYNKASSNVFSSLGSGPVSPALSDRLLSIPEKEALKAEIDFLQIEKNTINVMGTPQLLNNFAGSSMLLKDIVEQFANDISKEHNALSLSASRFIDDVKQTFGVILTKTKWDEENAVAIVLNDTTDHENLLALKIADENKDKTLATVSHELRTPLNGIIGILDVAKAKIADTEVTEYLELCKDNARLLLNLVNSILDLQQIKKGKLKLNVENVNIKKVFKDVTRLFHFQCNQKGIYLNLEIQEYVPSYIFTDQNRLKQVLINLVGNAIKFTSKGGITIGITSEEESDCLSVSVSDTGIGIKDEDKGKLFKMYGKLKDGENVNKNGVGLGLTISNALAQLLSGRMNDEGINITSEYGEGTTFRFTLATNLEKQINTPLRKPKNDMKAIFLEVNSCSDDDDDVSHENPQGVNFQPKLTHSNSNSMLLKGQTPIRRTNRYYTDKSEFYRKYKAKLGTILVVDDNPFNLMVARNNIDRLGYDCDTANNGSEAIDKVKANASTLESYKAILMDQQMPILDGIAATKVLKSMMDKGEVSPIPIIALTANNDEESMKECYEVGMSDYLAKPLKVEDLSSVLSKIK